LVDSLLLFGLVVWYNRLGTRHHHCISCKSQFISISSHYWVWCCNVVYATLHLCLLLLMIGLA